MPASRALSWIVPTLTVALAMPCMSAAETTAAPAPTGTGAAIGQSVGQVVDTALNTLKWGAYGEMHYNNFQSETTNDRLEMHRFVLLGEAQLHEQVRLVAEIEIEHALVEGDDTGALELEQAYLDYRYTENHSARAGMMLVPISIGNLYHEPTVFHGVERPLINRVIIPTTWFESGIGAQGSIASGLEYTAAIQAGLDANGGLASDNGIREGRQEGMESNADDFTYCGRLDYRPLPGLWLATGLLYGELNQKSDFDSDLLLYTLEARYDRNGLELGATWAQGNISNPDEIPGFDPADPVPEVFEGLEAFAAYDILPLITESSQRLFVFGRYEMLDNQAEVPSGATSNEAYTIDIFTYGLTYKPIPSIVIKADYQDVENDAESAEDTWNLGVGFAF
jgi:hypothetical protein